MPSRRTIINVYFIWFLVLSLISVRSVAAPLDTESLFERLKESIVQVKISNIHSGEKSSIGSGFFVSPNGYLITNYHVISSVVREPENYRAELILHNGDIRRVSIVDIELIHDLALLKSEIKPAKWLRSHPGRVKKGTEIASIGNPHDLGMTVVKGSYSGQLEGSLYKRIHFTGAINPGMSGGPVVNGAGEVIGVNVATAGNEVGFLVPAEYARTLLGKAKAGAGEFDAQKTMHKQLQSNQENFSRTILTGNLPVTELGEFLVPDKLAPFMKCWGDSVRDEKKPYRITSKQCATDSDIYIDRNYSTGRVSIEHHFIESDELSAQRFSKLYEVYFDDTPAIGGSKEDFTRFECSTDFVHTGSIKMKLALCLRRHRKFDDLYDLLLKGASLERATSGIQTTLLVTGINYGNAMELTRNYIKAFRWKE